MKGNTLVIVTEFKGGITKFFSRDIIVHEAVEFYGEIAYVEAESAANGIPVKNIVLTGILIDIPAEIEIAVYKAFGVIIGDVQTEAGEPVQECLSFEIVAKNQ